MKKDKVIKVFIVGGMVVVIASLIYLVISMIIEDTPFFETGIPFLLLLFILCIFIVRSKIWEKK